MNLNLHRQLSDLLQHRNPRRALLVSHSTWPALANWDPDTCQLQHLRGATRYSKQDGLVRYDMALVLDQLEHMRRHDAIELLAQLRDRHTPFLAVLADLGRLRSADGAWNQCDFIALGLEPSIATPEPGVGLYIYDLANYNTAREWNNPRHWAHPENFRKFRW